MEPPSVTKCKTVTEPINDRIKHDKQGRTPNKRRKEMLLGLGFLIQGFRCFPWMAVIFFHKDGLRVDPSTLQILLNSANLPMVAKPFYGLVYD